MKLSTFNWIALIVLIVGGINLGLLGLINFDLISFVLGPFSFLARIVYMLVGAAAVYVAMMATNIMKISE